MQYYGAFYRSALNPLLSRINAYVMRWIRNKYKRLRTTKKAKACWQRITRQHPRLGGQDDKSPVTRDCHAGICGSRRVRPPTATRQQLPLAAAASHHHSTGSAARRAVLS